MLERYGHGGDLRSAADAFGLEKERFLDFSANMNPIGPPAAVETAIFEHWRDIARYPDPVSRELTAAIARRYGIPEESILIGNGAAELIDLLVRVLHPAVTALAQPSFGEYEQAVMNAGGSQYAIPLREETGFTLQMADVESALRKADLLFLGHPNNPTGKLLPKPIIDAVLSSGSRLALDEAFIDFYPEEEQVSCIRAASANPNLFVIRSLTKYYTIPGIRLGFIVAHPDHIRALRKRQVPWSVNVLAQEIGLMAMGDADYAERTKRWLASERPWLTAKLRELGLTVTDSDTNFLLFALPDTAGMTIKDVQRAMGRRGVLIRDASLFPGLDERYGRTAIRVREHNELLVEALSQTLNEGRDRHV
jgi:threonine-phosphate decarboxylase